MTAERIPIGVITNPNSKKNRARGGRAAELQRILGPLGVVRETRSISEIGPAVRDLLERDVRYWVSDGGDGALHWLLNEARPVFAQRGLALPLTLPTNGGTIDFVAKKVGIRGEADEILRRLVRAEAEGRPVPVAEVPSFLMSAVRVEADGAERTIEKIGFAAAVAGIGQRFFDLYYLDPLPGPETVVRIIAKAVGSIGLNAPLIRSMPAVPARWRDYIQLLMKPQRARVRVDGRTLAEEAFTALHVGSMFVDIGGIARLFPLARDGKLDVMTGRPDMRQAMLNLPNLFLGRPMGWGFDERAAEEVEVEACGSELLRPCIDGEVFRDIRRLKIVPGPKVRVARIDDSFPK